MEVVRKIFKPGECQLYGSEFLWHLFLTLIFSQVTNSLLHTNIRVDIQRIDV